MEFTPRPATMGKTVPPVELQATILELREQLGELAEELSYTLRTLNRAVYNYTAHCARTE